MILLSLVVSNIFYLFKKIKECSKELPFIWSHTINRQTRAYIVMIFFLMSFPWQLNQIYFISQNFSLILKKQLVAVRWQFTQICFLGHSRNKPIPLVFHKWWKWRIFFIIICLINFQYFLHFESRWIFHKLKPLEMITCSSGELTRGCIMSLRVSWIHRHLYKSHWYHI